MLFKGWLNEESVGVEGTVHAQLYIFSLRDSSGFYDFRGYTQAYVRRHTQRYHHYKNLEIYCFLLPVITVKLNEPLKLIQKAKL